MFVRISMNRKLLAAAGVFLTVAFATGATFGSDPSQDNSILRVNVTDGGQPKVIFTRAATAGEALSQAGLVLDNDDKVYPSLDTPVTAGMHIRILRIETKLVPVNENILRETIRRAVGNIRPGFSKISDAGADGMRRTVYSVTYCDGRKVSKELVSSQIITKPRPRTVLYGRGSELPSRGFYSRKVMTMEATAYDPGPRSCGRWATGRTATGMRAGRGVVAVDPKVIRLGTKLYIEGYGFAVAGDTGGAIKGKKIDLGHNSYSSAMRFGRRRVVVHVLN